MTEQPMKEKMTEQPMGKVTEQPMGKIEETVGMTTETEAEILQDDRFKKMAMLLIPVCFLYAASLGLVLYYQGDWTGKKNSPAYLWSSVVCHVIAYPIWIDNIIVSIRYKVFEVARLMVDLMVVFYWIASLGLLIYAVSH